MIGFKYNTEDAPDSSLKGIKALWNGVVL